MLTAVAQGTCRASGQLTASDVLAVSKRHEGLVAEDTGAAEIGQYVRRFMRCAEPAIRRSGRAGRQLYDRRNFSEFVAHGLDRLIRCGGKHVGGRLAKHIVDPAQRGRDPFTELHVRLGQIDCHANGSRELVEFAELGRIAEIGNQADR
jgi:hypothetical protein